MAHVIDLTKLRAINSRAIQAMKRGVEGGVTAIVKDAALLASNTPQVQKRTGAMSRGWHYRVIRRARSVQGQLRNNVPHATHQEFGTGVFGPNRAPYWIVARKAKCLRFQAASGTIVFRRRVLHYGVHPRAIGNASMFGRRDMFFGTDHPRNVRILHRWISGELARVK
jgi:hypothetical protein